MKYLDRVVDRNFYPTPEAKASNQKWRPVGLGIMGLQDALFKMRIPFTSEEAKKISARISETIYYHAIQTSMKLAEEFGTFSEFKNSRYAEGKLQPQLAKDVGQAHVPEFHYNWDQLAQEVRRRGLRNSLMIAVAPTATIASIVGSYESIEPQVSNLFKRETLSGEFLQVNRYLIKDLQERGLWNAEMREKIVASEGSIQEITEIPADMRDLYKTVWEISQKDLIDMAVDRSTFICQSQSLNLFMESPTVGKLSSMYMYAWKQGVKTTYYLRSRAATKIQKVTASKSGPNAPMGAESAGTPVAVSANSVGAMAVSDQTSPSEADKVYTAEEVIACSLENPEACEACQ
jgi:ribonucleoside-diphosphate reductase alpha chain